MKDLVGELLFLMIKTGIIHKQGMKLTYAHHIMFSRDNVDLNQLSFGISAGFVQSKLDETSFYDNNPEFDPLILWNYYKELLILMLILELRIIFLDFYVHVTVKNVLASDRKLYSDREPDNLRRFILNAGYTFGDTKIDSMGTFFYVSIVTLTQRKQLI